MSRKRRLNRRQRSMVLALSLSLPTGAVLGFIWHNMALGVMFGMAFGAVLGIALGRYKLRD
jgi:hypothetical protein